MTMETKTESSGISSFICWDLGCKDKNILKIMVKESLEVLEETRKDNYSKLREYNLISGKTFWIFLVSFPKRLKKYDSGRQFLRYDWRG